MNPADMDISETGLLRNEKVNETNFDYISPLHLFRCKLLNSNEFIREDVTKDEKC